MSRILLSSPFFGQSSAVFTKWPDLSVLRSCRAQASWLPLQLTPVNVAVLKNAAAAALFSSLRPASRRTSQRPRSENAAGPTAPGYSTEQSTFHFRQVPVILCSPCQVCGAQLQHSRAPPPHTSERCTGSAARVAQALSERRPSSLTQPIPSGFSLCF